MNRNFGTYDAMEVINFVGDWTLKNIIIECDAMEVINFMEAMSSSMFPSGSSNPRLVSAKVNCQFLIIFSENPTLLLYASQLAWVAEYASQLPQGLHTFQSPPQGISNLLLNDVIGVLFSCSFSLFWAFCPKFC